MENLVRLQIVEECKKGNILNKPTKESCERIEENYCKAYAFPNAKWRNGWVCPLATHQSSVSEQKVEKQRVGQQKQKKKV